MQEDSNVVPLRNEKGHFVKGKSGNPSGVSREKEAIKSLSRDQQNILKSLFTAQVPAVVKVLRALVVKKGISDDNLIKVCKLILEYGIGKPTQVITTELPEEEDFDLSSYPAHVRAAMIKAISDIGKADDDA